MKIDLVRIGNSQGIRIPKPIIEQCGFGNSVEMTVKNKALVITSAKPLRQDWEEAFRAMAAAGDDRPIDLEGMPSNWDDTEWEW